MKGVDPAVPSPRKDAIRIPINRLEDNVSIAEPILSPVSVSSELGSFTVISEIDAGASRVLQLTGDTEFITPENVLGSMANASDRPYVPRATLSCSLPHNQYSTGQHQQSS
jgi:hypothetical protein